MTPKESRITGKIFGVRGSGDRRRRCRRHNGRGARRALPRLAACPLQAATRVSAGADAPEERIREDPPQAPTKRSDSSEVIPAETGITLDSA